MSSQIETKIRLKTAHYKENSYGHVLSKITLKPNENLGTLFPDGTLIHGRPLKITHNGLTNVLAKF